MSSDHPTGTPEHVRCKACGAAHGARDKTCPHCGAVHDDLHDDDASSASADASRASHDPDYSDKPGGFGRNAWSFSSASSDGPAPPAAKRTSTLAPAVSSTMPPPAALVSEVVLAPPPEGTELAYDDPAYSGPIYRDLIREPYEQQAIPDPYHDRMRRARRTRVVAVSVLTFALVGVLGGGGYLFMVMSDDSIDNGPTTTASRQLDDDDVSFQSMQAQLAAKAPTAITGEAPTAPAQTNGSLAMTRPPAQSFPSAGDAASLADRGATGNMTGGNASPRGPMMMQPPTSLAANPPATMQAAPSSKTRSGQVATLASAGPSTAARLGPIASRRVDVTRDLAIVRASLQRDDLNAARARLIPVLSVQPKNSTAQGLRNDIASREHQRDAALGVARGCAESQRWTCTWQNAGRALSFDSSSHEARTMVSMAVQQSRVPSGPPIDPATAGVPGWKPARTQMTR